MGTYFIEWGQQDFCDYLAKIHKMQTSGKKCLSSSDDVTSQDQSRHTLQDCPLHTYDVTVFFFFVEKRFFALFHVLEVSDT